MWLISASKYLAPVMKLILPKIWDLIPKFFSKIDTFYPFTPIDVPFWILIQGDDPVLIWGRLWRHFASPSIFLEQ